MPSKRDVLVLFARDELLAVVDRFGLAPPDRRAKDWLVETVASSKKATLADLLPELSRDRLKDICRALGLDESGREKSVLVERLAGGKTSTSPPPTTNGSASSKSNGGARFATAEPVEVEPGERLTTEKLERYLWSAADILRGSIDSGDYKGFIFGFLFLKRLSDRFDEECDALKANPNADPDDPDEHDFFVPKRARWSESLCRSARPRARRMRSQTKRKLRSPPCSKSSSNPMSRSSIGPRKMACSARCVV
jgi:type I restriction enzyme M protein